jgi:hypothetical protein
MAGFPGVNVNLPARAAQTAASGLVRGTSALVTSLVTSGFFIAAVGAVYFLMRKFITSARKNRLLSQVGQASKDGLAIGYAQRMYTAMISGYEWWNDLFGDNTDEEALYQVGREMRASQVDFSLVSSKYKVLYNRELIDDLTHELNADEMAKFQAALTQGLGGLGAVAPSVHHFLYTVAPTIVHDDELRPVGPVPAYMALGEHTDTLLGQDGSVWHGYPYQDLIRFVPASDVDRREF